jgi:hypothetical protein
MTIQEVTIPRARTTDPATSHDAAASVTGVTETQAIILMLLRETPMCDEKLIQQYRMGEKLWGFPHKSDSGIRSRRAELVRKGFVETLGLQERMTTGRFATVWQVVR